jgi:hypothetical protein
MQEPIRAKDRRANVDPRLRKSRTETAEPSREKLRSDSDDPKCTQSTTESVEPTRAIPQMDKVDPRRPIDLNDIEAPNLP